MTFKWIPCSQSEFSIHAGRVIIYCNGTVNLMWLFILIQFLCACKHRISYLLPSSLISGEGESLCESSYGGECSVTVWGFGDIWATVFEVRSTEGKWPTRPLVRWLPVCRGLGPVDVAGVRGYDRTVTSSLTASTGRRLQWKIFDAYACYYGSKWAASTNTKLVLTCLS